MKHEKRSQTAKLVRKQEGEAEVYSIVASTPAIDRDNEVILPRAYKKSLKPYLKDNPVILFMHDFWKPSIGKAISGSVGDDALRLDIEWADTEAGREVKYLYDNGFMNTFSVSFIPVKALSDPNDIMKELTKLGWDFDGDQSKLPWRVYTEVELLEVSAVTVPSNREAVMVRALADNFEHPIMQRCFAGVDENESADTINTEADEPAGDAKSSSPNGEPLPEARPDIEFAEAAVRLQRREQT